MNATQDSKNDYSPPGILNFKEDGLVILWKCRCQKGESQLLRILESKKVFDRVLDLHRGNSNPEKIYVYQNLRRGEHILIHTDLPSLSLQGFGYDMSPDEESLRMWNKLKGSQNGLLVEKQLYVVVPISQLRRRLLFSIEIMDPSGTIRGLKSIKKLW